MFNTKLTGKPSYIMRAMDQLAPKGNWFAMHEEDYSTLEWDDNNLVTKPTEAQIAGLAEELWAADAYIIPRRAAYPSLQEQADMQYWDAVNGTTTWQDAIAAVKDAHPKP